MNKFLVIFFISLSLKVNSSEYDLNKDCHSAAYNSQSDFSDVQELLNALITSDKFQCKETFQEKCTKDITVDPKWHIQNANIDLMNAEMVEWRKKVNSTKVPVAIVDGGFGPNVSNYLTNKLNVHQTASYLGNFEGHGAHVSQFLTGKDGIGVAPFTELHGYDVGIVKSPFLSPDMAHKSLMDACNSGQKIINASYGFNKEADKDRSEFKKFKNEIEWLAERGCLLIHASGNDSITDASSLEDYRTLYGIHLSVGALRKSGGVTSFSDEGSIYAPGENLLINIGDQPSKNICDPSGKTLVSGTSYSAPITAGVAANVREVLQTSDRFKKLSNIDQVKLEVQILSQQSNESANYLDGLKSVKLAMDWTNGKNITAKNNDSKCTELPTMCLDKKNFKNCGVEEQCSKILRSNLSLCHNDIAKNFKKYMEASLINDDLSLKIRILESIINDPNIDKENARKIVDAYFPKKYWEDAIESSKFPYKDSLPIYDIYLKLRLKTRVEFDEVDTKYANFVLTSSSTFNLSGYKISEILMKDKKFQVLLFQEFKKLTIGEPAGKNRRITGGDTFEYLKAFSKKLDNSDQVKKIALDFFENLPPDQAIFNGDFALEICKIVKDKDTIRKVKDIVIRNNFEDKDKTLSEIDSKYLNK